MSARENGVGVLGNGENISAFGVIATATLVDEAVPEENQ